MLASAAAGRRLTRAGLTLDLVCWGEFSCSILMPPLQIGREEASVMGLRSGKVASSGRRMVCFAGTAGLRLHLSFTHRLTGPRHRWDSAHSNLAPCNDHERSGAGRPEDQRFHLLDHEHMIHVLKNLTSKILQTTIFHTSFLKACSRVFSWL
jgi:hypothetical protein